MGKTCFLAKFVYFPKNRTLTLTVYPWVISRNIATAKPTKLLG